MNIFNHPRRASIKQSRFRPSFNYSGSFYPGYMYPILCKKVMPGDTWYIASNPKLWFQPLISPMLNNIKVDIRYFYVRNLLVWDNFDQYLTGQQRHNPSPSNIVAPYFIDFQVGPSSDPYSATSRVFYLFDSLYGCLPSVVYHRIDPLPARAYNIIYNEYYRAEFLATGAVNDRSDGQVSSVGSYFIRMANYKKDYFTSALPFPQFGDGVALPGLVVLDPQNSNHFQKVVTGEGNNAATGAGLLTNGDTIQGGVNILAATQAGGGRSDLVNVDPNGTLKVNIDIRDLRTASAVQRYLERSAIGGNRYAEYMLTHFGVRTPDNSSFRPQYLGGGDQYINISPVEQNSQTDTTPQGNLAGRGRLDGLVGMNHAYFFTEHGWIMAIMCIRPEAEYYGGIQRQFHVFEDVLDNYCVPILQNVGMQEIRNEEISAGASDPDGTFGYTEQYMSYKSFPNEVHGALRDSQRSWLASRPFTSNAPALNASFLAVSPDCLQHQVAVDGYPPVTGMIHHDIICKRPLQYHAGYKLG